MDKNIYFEKRLSPRAAHVVFYLCCEHFPEIIHGEQYHNDHGYLPSVKESAVKKRVIAFINNGGALLKLRNCGRQTEREILEWINASGPDSKMFEIYESIVEIQKMLDRLRDKICLMDKNIYFNNTKNGDVG